MPLAIASVPSADWHAPYLDYLGRGRGNTVYWRAARQFFQRWPDPSRWVGELLETRLSAGSATRPIITFLMLHRGLRPGYDYLLERKLSPIWREVKGSPLAPDLDRFMAAAAGLGFTERVRFGTGSQVPARLLIQTGRRLQDLTLADLAEFTAACHDREKRTGKGHKALFGSGQQHPASAVSPRHRRSAATIGWSGPVGRTAGRCGTPDQGDHDRLPGTQAGDLPTQDGVGYRHPAHPLRGVPGRRRSRASVDRRAGAPPPHRALPDIAGRCRQPEER